MRPVQLSRVLAAAFVLAFVAGFGYGRVEGVPWRVPGATPALAASGADAAAPSTAPPATSPSTTTEPSTTVPPTTALPTTAPPTTEAPPTTPPPRPPAGRRPTPEDPLRVVMAGDSVMAGLWPPVKAALETGGAAQVHFVLTPTILRDPSIRFTWEKQLEDFDPEVIVMFVGTWESHEVSVGAGQSVTLGDPAWRQSYEREVLDPWVRFISGRGARVVWIGSPIAAGGEANSFFVGLNEVFRGLPDRFGQVSYIDATRALQADQASFQAVVAGLDGQPRRIRQLDGLHLCPEGGALLAVPLIRTLQQDWEVPVAFNWQNLPWRDDAKIYPSSSCPPA